MELLVTISIIAVLASMSMVALRSAALKARDVKRKQAVTQVGRFLSGGACFMPADGPGDYDLAEIADDFKARYPAAANFGLPRDPRGGTNEATGYRFYVSADAATCAVYANLERDNEQVTLASLDAPGAGRGSGVLRSDKVGRNGTELYFQASN